VYSYVLLSDKLQDLFHSAGFKTAKIEYVYRETINRKQGLCVPRVFVQGKFTLETHSLKSDQISWESVICKYTKCACLDELIYNGVLFLSIVLYSFSRNHSYEDMDPPVHNWFAMKFN